jgi:hypothetical protein
MNGQSLRVPESANANRLGQQQDIPIIQNAGNGSNPKNKSFLVHGGWSELRQRHRRPALSARRASYWPLYSQVLSLARNERNYCIVPDLDKLGESPERVGNLPVAEPSSKQSSRRSSARLLLMFVVNMVLERELPAPESRWKCAIILT